MQDAELWVCVTQMPWIEEGAHLLYSFYSHFSIKEKWDLWEINVWREPSQRDSLKKTLFLCLEEGKEGKGTDNPLSFDILG